MRSARRDGKWAPDYGGNDLGVDMLKGAVAGAIGVWAMDRVDWFMYLRLLDTPKSRRQTDFVRPSGMDPAHAMANRGARALGLTPPAPWKQNPAGLAVHYSLGIAPGALYGALRGRVPYVDAGGGLLYGLGLFVVEDEIANPLMRFAAPPQDYPWQAHVRGFVAHLVYGAVTELVMQALTPPRRNQRPPGRPRAFRRPETPSRDRFETAREAAAMNQ